MVGPYTFKIATEPWELEQVKSLNYETFVEEVPQHPAHPSRSLTDTFDAENTYLICVQHRQVLAMLAIRGQRPFSLDRKLENLDAYLPRHRPMCELRLLAARKTVRNSRIVRGLLARTANYCLQHNYRMVLISGVLEQLRLYQHLGFVPFGPVVGTERARFQPMYLTVERHLASKKPLVRSDPSPVNLLPGPVDLSPAVQQALIAPPLSHRSDVYLQLHRRTQQRLARLVGAKYVQVFTGSGTLANDVIAGQLSLLPGKGLVLCNGEFGRRLAEQARSFGLTFETLSLPWAQPFSKDRLCDMIGRTSDLQWLWAVLAESSTGVLNDVNILKAVANTYRLRLCLDCISAVGNTPVNLKDVYLASACSSKGLRSIAGLAMVFYNHTLTPPSGPLPIYVDLYAYQQAHGVPFSIPSNLVGALSAAMDELETQNRMDHLAQLDAWLRRKLSGLGLTPLATPETACPGIITVPLPRPLCSQQTGDCLKEAGFVLSYESAYLKERNWLQFCLMSEVPKGRLEILLDTLEGLLSKTPPGCNDLTQ